MKKNNEAPELATFTLLNPDFHTSESQLTDNQISNENIEGKQVKPEKLICD